MTTVLSITKAAIAVIAAHPMVFLVLLMTLFIIKRIRMFLEKRRTVKALKNLGLTRKQIKGIRQLKAVDTKSAINEIKTRCQG